MYLQWQYDETVSLVTDFFNENEVRDYDRRMACLRDINREMEGIIEDLGITEDFVVWEIGTGTGECALALSRVCAQVYATDISGTMLEYAGRKAESEKRENIRFEVGGFLSGFTPPAPVDSVVSQLAMHHIPDFWKSRALTRIAGALKPGGRFFLRDAVFPSDIEDYDSYIRDAVREMREKAGEEMSRKMIQHIKREYSTLDWILEGMMERSGLKIIKRERRGFIAAYVCEK